MHALQVVIRNDKYIQEYKVSTQYHEQNICRCLVYAVSPVFVLLKNVLSFFRIGLTFCGLI